MKFGRDPMRASGAGAARDAAERPGTVEPLEPRTFSPQHSLLEYARQTRAARARHAGLFPKGVFRDRAWDIMIELFIAAGEGRTLCVKDAMVIAGDSPAGSVRRVDSLEDAELVVRRTDPDDHRRVMILLSERGVAAMSSFLRDLHLLDGPVAPAPPSQQPVTFRPLDRNGTP